MSYGTELWAYLALGVCCPARQWCVDADAVDADGHGLVVAVAELGCACGWGSCCVG